ncbi:MAG TPA: hypothetical protein VFU17_08705 [Candidatus Limnocylindrales bacterium]|nr:hypothetical protein [Candidatus Limnocylindrales bacterium]
MSARSPSPDDFDEQLERLHELSVIEHRLLLAGSDGEGSHLRRRRAELMSAIRAWNMRFLGAGNGDGGAY